MSLLLEDKCLSYLKTMFEDSYLEKRMTQVGGISSTCLFIVDFGHKVSFFFTHQWCHGNAVSKYDLE